MRANSRLSYLEQCHSHGFPLLCVHFLAGRFFRFNTPAELVFSRRLLLGTTLSRLNFFGGFRFAYPDISFSSSRAGTEGNHAIANECIATAVLVLIPPLNLSRM